MQNDTDISPTHRAIVRKETLVSMALNAILPAAAIWALEGVPPQRPWGEASLLPGLLAGAGLPTLAMTLGLTTALRAKVRKGRIPPLNWPRAGRGVMQWVPEGLALRTLMLTLLALLVLVPLGMAAATALGALPMTRTSHFVFNLAYGAVVGLVVTPFIVLPAIADRQR